MKKKVLITGGSRGIGLAIARKFYEGGFEVLICARGAEGLEKAKAEMPDIHTFQCDISKREEVLAFCEAVNKNFGALDLLVNNGGQYLQGHLHLAENVAYEQLLRTNVDSAFYFTRELIKPMKERKQGTVVMMASVASLKAYQDGGLYGFTKYAMMGLARNFRAELAKEGIRVITIFPGAVKTSSWDWADIDEARFIPVEDIAELVWSSFHLSGRTVVEDIVVRPSLGDI